MDHDHDHHGGITDFLSQRGRVCVWAMHAVMQPKYTRINCYLNETLSVILINPGWFRSMDLNVTTILA